MKPNAPRCGQSLRRLASSCGRLARGIECLPEWARTWSSRYRACVLHHVWHVHGVYVGHECVRASGGKCTRMYGRVRST